MSLAALDAAGDEKGAPPAPQEEAVAAGPGFWPTLFSLEEVKEKNPDEKRWFFTLGAWYERNLGNVDYLRANGSALLEYRNGIAECIVSYQQFYSESDGAMHENSGSGIVRYDRFLVSMLEYFIFSQADYNSMLGLRIRSGSGTGLKLVFFRNRYWITDISAAPVFEYEKFTTRSPRREFRASFRYRVKMHVFGFLHLHCSVFYVPLIRNFREYRFNIDTDATLNITRNADESGGLLLKGGYRRFYNTFALTGYEKLDQIMYAQIQLML